MTPSKRKRVSANRMRRRHERRIAQRKNRMRSSVSIKTYLRRQGIINPRHPSTLPVARFVRYVRLLRGMDHPRATQDMIPAQLVRLGAVL